MKKGFVFQSMLVVLMVSVGLPASAQPTRADEAQEIYSKNKKSIGVCHGVDGNPFKAERSIFLSPEVLAKMYFYRFEGKKINEPSWQKTTLITPPLHGKLELVRDPENSEVKTYLYTPNVGFSGDDKIVFSVMTEAGLVTIVQVLKVQRDVAGDDQGPVLCKKTGELWKISSAADFLDGKPIQRLMDILEPGISGWQLTGLASEIGFAGVLHVADLPGSALGQTTGSIITLDTNAAGHGWYFDWQGTSDDWLPTSNPYEWMARPGSAAEGRMDFLSVFLHEYGHALGLEHSHDSHDHCSRA